jgi:Zn finger protein HypA/HybF involved in hydrogenase expression
MATKANGVKDKDIWRRIPAEITKEEIEAIAPKVRSWSAMARALGLVEHGYSVQALRDRTMELGIDVVHFFRLRQNAKGNAPELTNEALFSNRPGKTTPGMVIKRMVRDGIRKLECEECGQGEEWRGGKLGFRLQHLNENSQDYRLDNIRIICPNCHSVLIGTLASKKGAKKRIENMIERRKQARYEELLRQEQEAAKAK